MVTYIRELSEDEKIRQQCQAREDYERRLIGEYNRGNREGEERGEKRGIQLGSRSMLINLVKSGDISIERAADKLGMSSDEFAKLI